MQGMARHMSMLRSFTPADLLTIGNAACGTLAILLCLEALATQNPACFWVAMALLPVALIFDVLDGYTIADLAGRKRALRERVGIAELAAPVN